MAVKQLFRQFPMLRAVIDAVLEGRAGRVVTDDDAAPRIARLDIGCYSIFGGAAEHPAAERLVRSAVAPIELVGPDQQSWRDLFVAVHGSRLTDRPMRTFATHALDVTRLAEIAAAPPDGFAVARLGASLAEQLDGELEPHALQVAPSTSDFVKNGVGFGVVRDGCLASAATSYTASARRVEVAIATRPDYRGRGLARNAAAALLAHCLDHDLVPEWSASNPVSKRLALSLGYLPGPICDIFYLE